MPSRCAGGGARCLACLCPPTSPTAPGQIPMRPQVPDPPTNEHLTLDTQAATRPGSPPGLDTPPAVPTAPHPAPAPAPATSHQPPVPPHVPPTPLAPDRAGSPTPPTAGTSRKKTANVQDSKDPGRYRQCCLPARWTHATEQTGAPRTQRNRQPTLRPQATASERSKTTLKLATQNVRGIQANKQDILSILHERCPDVLMVTETRLTQAHKHSKHARNGYDGYHSWVSSTPVRKAGLLLLLHHTVTLSATVRHRPLPTEVQGYLMSTTDHVSLVHPDRADRGLSPARAR